MDLKSLEVDDIANCLTHFDQLANDMFFIAVSLLPNLKKFEDRFDIFHMTDWCYKF